MIDTHIHILPGVDNGPATLPEALDLARALVQEGVSIAIATPHYNDEFPHRPASEIITRVQHLQQHLTLSHIPLRLCSGHEVLIKSGLLQDIRTGQIATLNNSRYLLLELWSSIWLPETEHLIFELREQGIIPIIAHPETSRPIQQDPARLTTLLQLGALAQATISNLLSPPHSIVRRTVEHLLQRGHIHCLASDTHPLNRRSPQIAQGLHAARHLLGAERVHFLTQIQPTAIFANQPITSIPLFPMKLRRTH